MTSLDDTLRYLYDLQLFGMKLGLENIRRLCEHASRPQGAYRSFHIAGTNGKGSTCAMLASVLQKAGYRVGLYTSPHIHRFHERIRVNGDMISDEDLIRWTQYFRSEIDKRKCTFFEATTAIAFSYFAEQRIDVAVIETGLGGRLDATNILDPEIAIITSVGLDHTEHLGSTVEAIALEKAGIIKRGSPVVIGWMEPNVKGVFQKESREKSAALFAADDCAQIRNVRVTASGVSFDLDLPDRTISSMETSFHGRHQAENAALVGLALSSLRAFPISEDVIRAGLREAKWKGRFHVVGTDPLIIVDAAHNASAFEKLLDTLESTYPGRRKHLIIGMLKDKDYRGITERLESGFERIVTVRPNSPRALDAEELARCFRRPVEAISKTTDALDYLRRRASTDDLIVVSGSHFVLSEVDF